ncbi:type IV pilus modification PilV family protein [Stenomitos frigidus]|nr:type II secretion system protein [Stenomitos frigidus]
MRVSSTRSASEPTERSLPKMAPKWALSLLLADRKRLTTGGLRRSRQSEYGLTIIECLVAIVVISLTVVAITPPIMLATASRIQSRKVEKANQVAQGEIDRVRLLVERGSYQLSDLPGTAGAINGATTISSFGAATGSPTGGPLYSTASCSTYPTVAASVTTLIRVDVDGDCKPEYVMQVFRTPGYAPTSPAITATTVPFSFEMGVRVYAYYEGQTFIPLDTTKASMRMGTGPLDLAGGKRRPMAVLYSKMARNDSSRSLGQLCIQNAGTTGQTCNY